MQSMSTTERPPHVKFEIRPVEDRAASIASGHAAYKDVEFAVITPQGGSLTVEKEVTDDVIDRFRAQYEAWKRNEEAPISGFPLKMWPPVTPAFLETCKGLQLLAVEDLAAANEKVLEMLGPGARAWKEKARVWLETADAQGKPAEQIAALTVRVEQLEAQIKDKDAAINALRDKLGEDKPRRGRPPKNRDDD